MAGILSILGAIAVILGAFGAHGLEEQVSESSMEVFRTAVRYHFLHVIAGLILTLMLPKSYSKWVSICFIAGIALFSGSLYLIASAEINGISTGILGPITPIGGALFIGGWLVAAYGFFDRSSPS